MKSIKNVLLSFSLILIVTFVIPFFLFVFLHLKITSQYEDQMRKLILEQDIPQNTNHMILNYYYAVSAINDKEKLREFKQSETQFNSSYSYLDKNITNDDSKIYYIGIKNGTTNIEKNLEKGIAYAQKGNISQNSSIYETANRDNNFIKELAGNLLLGELQDIETTQAQLKTLNNLALNFILITFLIITVASIIFSWFFSHRITSPLISLSEIAKKISWGNIDLSIDLNLLDKKDETGILATSFQIMLVTIRDKISKLQASEVALRNEKKVAETEEAKQAAILESIGDGMIVTDNNGNIMLMNNAAQEMINLQNTPFYGKSAYALFQLQQLDNTPVLQENRPLSLALKTRKKIDDTYNFVEGNEKKFVVNITATPVIEKEQVIGIVELLRDVTKEKEIDRMKTEFISLASHQLRTPLSAIRWFTDMLLDGDAGQLNPEQTDFAKNVSESTLRMIELVNSLLNISRIESGRILIDPKPTDLKELVQGVVTDLKAKIEERKQNLVISVHEDLPKVNLDPKLIRQVYMNLLTNAIKYTPTGGDITVFISKKDEEIVSQVSDNGYGIPKTEQAKIFQKFFRAENILKIETDGTGLGLYLIKAIIDSSHGKIWFESQENKGTSFWFSLPMSGMQAKKGEVTLDE